jgi:cyclopropane fatty-acyl-phospholipid synthase-like methyltransferase
MRSNVENWKEMQDRNYFESHHLYKGLVDLRGDFDCQVIEWFLPLMAHMTVVVIGCGYGREIAHIAPRVDRVYGIDVSEVILQKAMKYLCSKAVGNFTGVLADDYEDAIPNDVDLVYSIVVMQHLTRDLVRNYFSTLGKKLSREGRMIVQFLEDFDPNADPVKDAELRTYEPSVSWTLPQIAALVREARAGLKLQFARSYLATPTALWHWVCIGKNEC